MEIKLLELQSAGEHSLYLRNLALHSEVELPLRPDAVLLYLSLIARKPHEPIRPNQKPSTSFFADYYKDELLNNVKYVHLGWH